MLPTLLVIVTLGGPVLQAATADSLVLRLNARESAAAGPRAAAEAALMLGRLYYARGEYRPAADAFARAAARLDPAHKSEALYWGGMSQLGLGSTSAARAAFDAVVNSAAPRRLDAMVGIAAAWEREGQPDRAYDELEHVLADTPGEAGAQALERLAALADRLHRPADAERARARLVAAYPASMEATMAAASLKDAAAAPPPSGPVALEGGRFATAARAKALAARAARAGFATAHVVERGGGAMKSWIVILGTYPDRTAARKGQVAAARELGVSSRITGER